MLAQIWPRCREPGRFSVQRVELNDAAQHENKPREQHITFWKKKVSHREPHKRVGERLERKTEACRRKLCGLGPLHYETKKQLQQLSICIVIGLLIRNCFKMCKVMLALRRARKQPASSAQNIVNPILQIIHFISDGITLAFPAASGIDWTCTCPVEQIAALCVIG